MVVLLESGPAAPSGVAAGVLSHPAPAEPDVPVSRHPALGRTSCVLLDILGPVGGFPSRRLLRCPPSPMCRIRRSHPSPQVQADPSSSRVPAQVSLPGRRRRLSPGRLVGPLYLGTGATMPMHPPQPCGRARGRDSFHALCVGNGLRGVISGSSPRRIQARPAASPGWPRFAYRFRGASDGIVLGFPACPRCPSAMRRALCRPGRDGPHCSCGRPSPEELCTAHATAHFGCKNRGFWGRPAPAGIRRGERPVCGSDGMFLHRQ